jgi:hypothetical protein
MSPKFPPNYFRSLLKHLPDPAGSARTAVRQTPSEAYGKTPPANRACHGRRQTNLEPRGIPPEHYSFTGREDYRGEKVTIDPTLIQSGRPFCFVKNALSSLFPFVCIRIHSRSFRKNTLCWGANRLPISH